MPPPLKPFAPSDLIFSDASKSISSTLTTLKRTHLSISNRLHSISQDAESVQSVADAYRLPLVANERCGSWYISPSKKAGSAYFKSTDGHFGQWSFSLRRLNLQLLAVIAEGGGCIIVDSTRRGKSMPDALSKTIPIWIAVVNTVLFPEELDSHHLRTPEDVVSRSEHSQMEARLPFLVAELKSLDLDFDVLRTKLRGRPMEPVWLTPDSIIPSIISNTDRKDNHLIVLCTASGRTTSDHRPDSDYVQGAADDSESWACGLTAPKFWEHREQLLSTPEDDLPDLIQELVRAGDDLASALKPAVIVHSTNISIANNATAEAMHQDFDIAISCSAQPSKFLAEKLQKRYIHLACTTGKIGSRQLRSQLPKLVLLRSVLSPSKRVLVACATERDLCVGVALAIICLFYDDEGSLAPEGVSMAQSKHTIRKRLAWITTSMPEASPSRATLQSVNAFLLGSEAPQSSSIANRPS